MNRIVTMILKNMHILPGAFFKLWRYAADPEKYSEMEKWEVIHFIMKRAIMGGNIDLQVTGLENIPREEAFMMYPNHQGMFDVLAIASTCDVPLGAGMSSSAALESTFANALNELFSLGIDRFELARIGQSTEHNYCGVKCGIMDQFASIFGKAGHLMRLDCRSMEFEYFPFDPEQHGYKLVLLDSVVKHELVGSPYNDRRASCERVAAVLGQEFLRGATMEQLEAIKDKISDEDYKRARYVIGEEQRVLDVCEALKHDDYETVGKRMYETHWGMSRDYEVSCEELDFLATVAEECGVAGSRIMGGGFGGCTINLVKSELYDNFIATAKARFNEKYGHEPKVYAVVISDGARKLVL